MMPSLWYPHYDTFLLVIVIIITSSSAFFSHHHRYPTYNPTATTLVTPSGTTSSPSVSKGFFSGFGLGGSISKDAADKSVTDGRPGTSSTANSRCVTSPCTTPSHIPCFIDSLNRLSLPHLLPSQFISFTPFHRRIIPSSLPLTPGLLPLHIPIPSLHPSFSPLFSPPPFIRSFSSLSVVVAVD